MILWSPEGHPHGCEERGEAGGVLSAPQPGDYSPGLRAACRASITPLSGCGRT